jgi:phosphatidylserine decarboxylase
VFGHYPLPTAHAPFLFFAVGCQLSANPKATFPPMYNLLYLVPKNWLSRAVGVVMERRWPFGLHTVIRDAMIRAFKPVIDEAEFPLAHYKTWSEFFVRRLKPGARVIGSSSLVCPVDGTLTQRGLLAGPDALLTQVKGVQYTLKGLLGSLDPQAAKAYEGGSFLTVYLAPYNYHRIHSATAGRVVSARHIPGALWPVNVWSVQNIRDLFVRNDRIVVEMESDFGAGEGTMRVGRSAIALIGATNVGRTTLAFSNLHANDPAAKAGVVRDIPVGHDLRLGKADELACFEMGSTIVLVLDAAWTARLRPDLLTSTEALTVRLGQDFATL